MGRLSCSMKLFISLSLIMITFLVGCAQKETQTERVVKLRFAYWGIAEEQATTRKVVDLFNQTHPHIQVKFEHVSLEYQPKILTTIAGNSAPDIFGIDSTMIVFAQKGALLNLDPFLKEDKEIDISDYYPQVVEPFRYKGNLYTLPNEFSTIILFYNKDLFDKVGISYPDETWDWDTFLDAAKKLAKQDKSGRPIHFGVVFHIALPVFIYQNGGRVYNEDNTISIFNSPQTIEAMDFLLDLSRKHHVAPTPNEGQMITSFEAFPSGKAAMYFAGRWTVPGLRKEEKINWDIAPLPKGKERSTALCAHAIGISTQCKYPKEAWEFLKFMAGEPGERENARLGNLLPSLKKVAKSDVFLYDKEHPEEAKTNKIYLDSLSYVKLAWGWPINPNIPYKVASDIVDKEVDKAIFGVLASQEVSKRVEEELNELIKKQGIDNSFGE